LDPDAVSVVSGVGLVWVYQILVVIVEVEGAVLGVNLGRLVGYITYAVWSGKSVKFFPSFV